MSEEPERDEAQIEEVLAGRGGAATDPTVLWLAATARPSAPPALLARIEAQVTAVAPKPAARSDRRGLFLTVVAAALACGFVVQGIGGLFAGEWIADNLGEPYAPHPFREGALAMIAVGVCAAAAAVSRRW